MKYYRIEYFQKGCNDWVAHTFTNYKTLEEAKKEIDSYKEHKLGIKFRILEVKEVKI